MNDKKKRLVEVQSTRYESTNENVKPVLHTYEYVFTGVKGSVLARHMSKSPFEPGSHVVVSGNFQAKDGKMYASVADPKYSKGEAIESMLPKKKKKKVEPVVGKMDTASTAEYRPQTVEAEHSVTLGPNDTTTGNVVFANDFPAEITIPQSYIADSDLKLAAGSASNVWVGATPNIDLGNVPDLDEIEGNGSVEGVIEIGMNEYNGYKLMELELKDLKKKNSANGRYRRKTDERVEFEIDQKVDVKLKEILSRGDENGELKVSDTRQNALELATYGFAGRGDAIDPDDVTTLANHYYKWLLGQ
jgi:hypothetical protein